ncbi:hypothetical protein ACLB2K_049950 [Fragaria x ananassa]
MGSKVLPQALLTIPRHPNHYAPVKLGFSSAVSRRRPSFCSTGVSLSKASSSSVRSKFSPIVAAKSRRDFSVRAESEGEVGATENEEAVSEPAPEAVVDAEAGATLETEPEPEEKKPPRKPRIKLGDVMGILNSRAIDAAEKERPVPDIRSGDVVQIKLEVPENKRRLSIYKGIVISKQNAGIHTTFRIRRIIAGVGVEIVFPLYSPNIKELKVLSHRKVRRARLYYLRDKLPRLKPLPLRSTLYGPTLALYKLGTHVSSEIYNYCLPLTVGSAVTLQAQREYPPDMQCKDKFLLQSTIVPPNSDIDELPQDTFTKESGRTIEECKLRVVYLTPGSGQGNEDGASMRRLDTNSNQTFQRLKEERDSAVRQTQTLQQELNLSDGIDNVAALQDMFRKFGNVLFCKVAMFEDEKSKGYSFVQFESEESALAATDKLNGFTVADKQLCQPAVLCGMMRGIESTSKLCPPQ